MTIRAKVLLDSISPSGVRLTTFELYYPRFIHSEMNTHRMFSRNASSSRAIPTIRRLLSILKDPAVPSAWGGNQPGMVAKGELRGLKRIAVKSLWYLGCYVACFISALMHLCGVHKQVANRITEPWAHIKVVLSATELENFWKLRVSPDADPTMYALALAMRKAYRESMPVVRREHLPYLTELEQAQYKKAAPLGIQAQLAMVSVARCARVSYVDHDGAATDMQKDLILARKLMKAGHLSPAEHVAFFDRSLPGSGNFKAWRQFRHTFQG